MAYILHNSNHTVIIIFEGWNCTTMRACKPIGAVTMYDMLGCSLAASNAKAGISCLQITIETL